MIISSRTSNACRTTQILQTVSIDYQSSHYDDGTTMARRTVLLVFIGFALIGLATMARPNRKYNSGHRRNKFKVLNQKEMAQNNRDGARIVKSSHFDYDFELGHKIVLICVARGNPVPRITWFKDGIELYNHPYLQISEWKIGKDKIKVKMEITPARQMDIGTYECQANNKYRVDTRIFVADYTTAFI